MINQVGEHYQKQVTEQFHLDKSINRQAFVTHPSQDAPIQSLMIKFLPSFFLRVATIHDTPKEI